MALRLGAGPPVYVGQAVEILHHDGARAGWYGAVIAEITTGWVKVTYAKRRGIGIGEARECQQPAAPDGGRP